MKKLSPEEIQYKIPRTANRFCAVYKKPIFYLAVIAVFCIVASVTVAYNMVYFTTVSNKKIFINSRLFYDDHEYSYKLSPLFPRSRFPKGYDVYFVRYDSEFEGKNFGGYFANTVLEKEYESVKSCDDMETMLYVVNSTFSKVLAKLTYDMTEVGPTSEVQFHDMLYYVAWAVTQ